MPIYQRCPHKDCKSDQSLKNKKCSKCGEPLPRENKTYKVVVWHNTQAVTRNFTGPLEKAKNLEAKLKTELVEGLYYDRRKKAPTLDQIWKEYFTWSQKNNKGWKVYLSAYNANIREPFGKKELDRISSSDIRKFVLNLENKNRTPKHIKNVLALFNRLYNFAIEEELYEGNKPIKKKHFPKIHKREPETLSPEQLKALWDACEKFPDYQVGAIVKLLALTGRRRGEVLRLLWQDVDLAKAIYTIRDTKSGHDETLPMNQWTVKLLKKHPRVMKSVYVFPDDNGDMRKEINKEWKKIKQLTGLPPRFRLHDLRHSFASFLVSEGLDLYTVQKLLTHKTIAMTERYSHLADKKLHEGVQVMDQVLEEALSEGKNKQADISSS